MDLGTLESIAKSCSGPTGDTFLDSLFQADPSALYYRFIFRLVQSMKPALSVELGTYKGWCAAHMCAGHPGGKVVTVDPSPQSECAGIVARYSNLSLLKDKSDSPAVLGSIKDGSVDICLVDSVHESAHAEREVLLWTPKMRRSGVMLFDDISMNDDMRGFWDRITLRKLALPHLHWTGFGAVVYE